MAFTCCILVTRYTRDQNTTRKGHLAFQKATFSLENEVHSFLHPIIHSFYNKCGKGTVLHHKSWMECEQKRHIFKCHFETFCVDSAKNNTILPKGEIVK